MKKMNIILYMKRYWILDMKRFKIKLNFIRYFTFIPLVISEEKIRSYRNLRRFAMYRGRYRRTRMYRYLTNFLDRETWKRIVERKIKILEEILFYEGILLIYCILRSMIKIWQTILNYWYICYAYFWSWIRFTKYFWFSLGWYVIHISVILYLSGLSDYTYICTTMIDNQPYCHELYFYLFK